MTTSQRRPSPASRATRRSRRPAPRNASFLERNRNALLWVVGILVFALLVVVGFVLPAITPAYACGNEFNPTPSPSWVAPTPAPVASGATPAPAVTPPPPGFVQPDMGKSHTRPGNLVNWTWCPPASGRHYEAPAGPIPAGLYGPDDNPAAPGWVHNLEHGAIVLLYNCALAPEACTEPVQQTFETMIGRWPNSPICNIPATSVLTPVIARFEDMPYPYAAIVWDVVLPMQTLDEALIFEFYARNAERFNPEPQCAPPSPTPGPTATPAPSASPTAAPTAAPSPAATAAPAASTAPSP